VEEVEEVGRVEGIDLELEAIQHLNDGALPLIDAPGLAVGPAEALVAEGDGAAAVAGGHDESAEGDGFGCCHVPAPSFSRERMKKDRLVAVFFLILLVFDSFGSTFILSSGGN